jgi:hypothetical protein
MTVHFELDTLSDDLAFEVEMPFTQGRLDYWAGMDELGVAIDGMATPLAMLGWLLLITYVMGLAGCMGVAAHSLGADSRRVRVTTLITVFTSAVGVLAIVMPAIAYANADEAFVTLIGFIPADVSAGSGLLIGLAAPLFVFLLAFLYFRVLGPEFRKTALSAPVSEPELVQPMVEEALAEEAAAEVEEPLDVGGVPKKEPPLRKPVLSGLTKRPALLLVIVIAAIVVIAGIGYGLMGGGGDNGDDGDGRTPVDINELQAFTNQALLTLDMNEGQTHTFDVFSEVPWNDLDNNVFFVAEVTIIVTWQDEDDIGVVINRMENQPDTFMVEIYDDMQLDDVSDEASNTHGNPGEVSTVWSTSDPWVMVGNSTLVATGDQEVVTAILIEGAVTLTSAGDYQGFVRTQADNGNRCDIEIWVSGTFFERKL